VAAFVNFWDIVLASVYGNKKARASTLQGAGPCDQEVGEEYKSKDGVGRWLMDPALPVTKK
jgi:hypothetical protein